MSGLHRSDCEKSASNFSSKINCPLHRTGSFLTVVVVAVHNGALVVVLGGGLGVVPFVEWAVGGRVGSVVCGVVFRPVVVRLVVDR